MKTKFLPYFILFFVLFIGISPCVFAQFTFVNRQEYENPYNEQHLFGYINLEKRGLITYKVEKKTSYSENKACIIEVLDTTLQVLKKLQVVVPYDFTRNTSHFYNPSENQAFILCQNTLERKKFWLLCINLNDYTSKMHQSELPLRADIVDYNVSMENVYFTANDNGKTFAMYMTLSESIVKLLPAFTMFKDWENVRNLQGRASGNGVYFVSKHTGGRNCDMYIYPHSPLMGGRIRWAVKDEDKKSDKNYFEAKIFSEDAQNSWVFGTYNENCTDFVEGIYWAKFTGETQTQMNYKGFAYLDNYFNYLPKKRAEKLRKKAKDALAQKKPYTLSRRMLLDPRFYFEKDQVILKWDAYNPQIQPFQSANTFPYGAGSATMARGGLNPYYYQNINNRNAPKNEYHYAYTVVVAWDKKGNLLWDNVMELEDVTTDELAVQTEMGHWQKNGKEYHVLAYIHKKDIYYKVFTEKENTTEKEQKQSLVDIFLPKGYKVDDNGAYSFIHWYDNVFLWIGDQELRNGNVKNPKRQDVWHASKFVFDWKKK